MIRNPLSDNATTIGTHAQLGYGGNMLSVDSYRIDAGGIQISLSVTTTGCIPVLESFRGSLDGGKDKFV